MKIIRLFITQIVLALVLAGALVSCTKESDPTDSTINNVVVYYVAGFNSLAGYLSGDIYDMEFSDYLPLSGKGNDVVVIFEHLARSGYSTPSKPCLLKIYRNKNAQVFCDTLKTYTTEDISADSQTLQDALQVVKDKFPAKNYGLIITSHGTGWLPAGYYAGDSNTQSRTIAQQEGVNVNYEIDIKNFANAFPMHMNYVIFDACLMGGVEVAYQMKDVADKVCFSQTEVPADGFDYTRILKNLVGVVTPDPVAVCKDFFGYYDSGSSSGGDEATISAIDCTQLDQLASVCKDIFAAHHYALAGLMDVSEVQGYFRNNKHYFYDLRDMVKHAGATDDELSRLDAALDQCVLYNAYTDTFMGIDIKNDCGLSSYLPAAGNAELNTYYKTLSWNQATGLVQ